MCLFKIKDKKYMDNKPQRTPLEEELIKENRDLITKIADLCYEVGWLKAQVEIYQRDIRYLESKITNS